MTNQEDPILAFREAMEAVGIRTKDKIVGDGVLHRVHVDGDGKGSRNGWYLLHVDERPAGVFGCKKRLGDEKIKWTMQGTKPLTPAERRELAEKARVER